MNHAATKRHFAHRNPLRRRPQFYLPVHESTRNLPPQNAAIRFHICKLQVLCPRPQSAHVVGALYAAIRPSHYRDHSFPIDSTPLALAPTASSAVRLPAESCICTYPRSLAPQESCSITRKQAADPIEEGLPEIHDLAEESREDA